MKKKRREILLLAARQLEHMCKRSNTQRNSFDIPTTIYRTTKSLFCRKRRTHKQQRDNNKRHIITIWKRSIPFTSMVYCCGCAYIWRMRLLMLVYIDEQACLHCAIQRIVCYRKLFTAYYDIGVYFFRFVFVRNTVYE